MTATATNKKPGLNLGKLSAVAQIAVKPAQPADAEIELSRIFSVKQVRKTFRNLEELAESFKLNGIIEPLVVHEEADGRYRIIVGERRFRAAPLAGLVKVPVIIKKGLNELQIRRLQVTENNDRDDLTAYVVRLKVDRQQPGKVTLEPLKPGMQTIVYVRTPSRTILDYLFEPVIDSMRAAFREPM